MFRILPAAALVLALTAPAAQADVVATTAKPTPLAAANGKVLYSEWDGSRYRLTQLGSGALDVPGSAKPFVADIGRGPEGHDVAVNARDDLLRLYDFETRRERKLVAGTVGSVSGDRLVFAQGRDLRALAEPRHDEAARARGGAQPRRALLAVRVLGLAPLEP